MIVPLACGAGIGVAVVWCARVWFQEPPPLRTALERLTAPRTLGPQTTIAQSGGVWRERLVRTAVRTAETLGYRFEGLRSDLDVTNRTLERHVLDKLLLTWAGLALPAVFVGVCAAMGASVPVVPAIPVALGLAVAGFFVPDMVLRHDAERARREVRAALSAYLDLVVIILAGGAGTETALFDAATVGTGPGYEAIRRALEGCRYSGTTPWAAFAHLGQRLGVEELRELAAAASLAGEHGAPVRDSLVAKATSLREHQLATAESDAEAATERMTIPLMMLLVGFVGFLGYPAFVRVLQL